MKQYNQIGHTIVYSISSYNRYYSFDTILWFFTHLSAHNFYPHHFNIRAINCENGSVSGPRNWQKILSFWPQKSSIWVRKISGARNLQKGSVSGARNFIKRASRTLCFCWFWKSNYLLNWHNPIFLSMTWHKCVLPSFVT